MDIAGKYILSRCASCGRDRNDEGGPLHLLPAGKNLPGFEHMPLCFYCYCALKHVQDGEEVGNGKTN